MRKNPDQFDDSSRFKISIENEPIESNKLFFGYYPMAISKNQALSNGTFSPSSDKKILYYCQVQDTTGFVKNMGLFSILIGFFAFFLMQWGASIAIILSWPVLITWLLPRHYKFVKFEKYSIIFGSGSVLSLFKQYQLYNLKKFRFDDIHHIRFDRWEKKKRGGQMDSFGRIEIKFDNSSSNFEILIKARDFAKLIKIFEKYKFQSQVQRKYSRGELILIFPNSALFGEF